MELEFTGERVVSGMAITYRVIEHLHRYAVTREFCGALCWTLVRALRSLGGKLTMVVAAHRLSAVAGSDKLVDLGNEITPVATLQTQCR